MTEDVRSDPRRRQDGDSAPRQRSDTPEGPLANGRRLEETLRIYKQLVDDAPASITVHDREGRFLYANRRTFELHGYSEEEFLATRLQEIDVPESAALIASRMERITETGEAAFEVSHYRKDGTIIPLHVHVRLGLWGDRTVFFSIASDMTERRRAAGALAESEERFRKAFYTSPDSINLNRMADGMYVSVNEGFSRITGYSGEETIGRTSLELNIWADERDRLRLVEALRRHGKVENLEAAFRMKNGALRHGLMSATMIVLNGVSHILSITRDITERRRMEEELRESEKKFRDLAELLPQVVFEIDTEGRFTYANRFGLHAFGYTAEEMASGFSASDLIAEEDRARALANIARVLRGEPVRTSEYLAVRKTGETFPVLIYSAPILHDGRVAGLRGILFDITDRKRLEAQLLQAQKMEAIGTLAGGIAHDFNNLLMGIQGNVSLLMMEMDPAHPYHERLSLIEEFVKRGAGLTRQLLGFARGGRYEVRPVDMNRIVRKTAEMFGRTKKEISIRCSFAAGLRVVEADEGQMEQVFMNLLVNAWQAMPGGGEIFLETRNVQPEETDAAPDMHPPGRYVRISVTDTGIGMDAQTRQRIFDPFFTTKEMGMGTGLGLAMVYGIVRGHGGTIAVSSEPGRGTTFHIDLPASEKDERAERPAECAVRTGSGTVLMVDDEAMILDVGRKMLERLGYRVFTAGSAQDAVSLYRERRDEIDLVILDMVMPVLSGGEIFDRLRDIHPGVRVLLSSGYSVNGEAQRIIDRGCRGFLQKPFQLEELSQKILQVLSP